MEQGLLSCSMLDVLAARLQEAQRPAGKKAAGFLQAVPCKGLSPFPEVTGGLLSRLQKESDRSAAAPAGKPTWLPAKEGWLAMTAQRCGLVSSVKTALLKSQRCQGTQEAAKRLAAGASPQGREGACKAQGKPRFTIHRVAPFCGSARCH